MTDRTERLWSESNGDLFHTKTAEILGQLERAKTFGLLTTDKDDRSLLHSGLFSIRLRDHDPLSSMPDGEYYEGQIAVRGTETDSFQLHVRPKAAQNGQRIVFTLTNGGSALDATNNLRVIKKDDPYYGLVKGGLTMASSHLNDTFWNNERTQSRARSVRQERLQNIEKRALIGGVVLLAIGTGAVGTYVGYDRLVWQPGIQAEEARKAYDQTKPQISGEPFDMNVYDFTLLKPETYNEIPNYGGDDTSFSSPRTVQVENGCVTLPGEFSENDQLVIALPSDSVYGHIPFTTGFDNGQASICLTETVVKDSRGKSDDDFTIAVQEK